MQKEHYYLISSSILYQTKDLKSDVIQQCNIIFSEKEPITKFSMSKLKELRMLLAVKYLQTSKLDLDTVEDFRVRIRGITYLGEMTAEEFCDMEEVQNALKEARAN